MANFKEKKEKLANLLEAYAEDKSKENELLEFVQALTKDPEFLSKELFSNIFKDITEFLPQLSRREIKQRALFIRTFSE